MSSAIRFRSFSALLASNSALFFALIVLWGSKGVFCCEFCGVVIGVIDPSPDDFVLRN